MTGRDLIIYILQNNLENEKVLKNGSFIGLMDENEASIKFNVGTATIRAWHKRGLLRGTKIGESIFFLKDSDDPKKEVNKHE